jgi:hypothetical protein
MVEENFKDTLDKVANVLWNNGIDAGQSVKILKEIGDQGIVFREVVDDSNWISMLRRKGLTEKDIYWGICEKFKIAGLLDAFIT